MPYHSAFNRRCLWLAPIVACVLLLLLPTRSDAVIYYTFAAESGGGIALLDIDAQTTEVRRHEVLFSEPGFTKPHKLAVSHDQQTLIMVNESTEQNAAIVRLEEGESAQVQLLTVNGVPDAVVVFGKYALIGADKGHLALVDLDKAEVVRAVNTREMLKPAGHKVEDIVIAPDQSYAVLSLQKDQKGQKSLGNRLVLIKLPSLEVICDLQLPRTRPALHNPNNDTEQGPGPEVIVLSPKTNRLGVSLDFYGGFALTDLDAALRGKPGPVDYVSTAPDGAWGTAFPDRLCVIPHPTNAGAELIVVLNSGDVGGGCVIDLAAKSVVTRFEAPHGLETPTYIPAARVVATSHAGKHKAIAPDKVEKTYAPSGQVLLYHVSNLESFGSPKVVDLPGPVNRLVAIDPTRSSLVAVVFDGPTGKDAATDAKRAKGSQLALIDTSTGKVVTTLDAHGKPQRLLHR